MVADSHPFNEEQDPDLHYSEKSDPDDPDPHLVIRLRNPDYYLCLFPNLKNLQKLHVGFCVERYRYLLNNIIIPGSQIPVPYRTYHIRTTELLTSEHFNSFSSRVADPDLDFPSHAICLQIIVLHFTRHIS